MAYSSPSLSPTSTPSVSSNTFSTLGRALSLYEQLPDLSQLRPNADASEYPPVRIDGKGYIKEEWTQKKRKRFSWIQQYGTFLLEAENHQKAHWLCNICDKKHKVVIFNAQSTNAAAGHLKADHRITSRDEDEESRGGIRNVLSMQRQAAKGATVAKTKYELFKSLLLEWIVDQSIPLTAVEHESFRAFLTVLSQDVDNYLPNSADTVRNWLMTEFDRGKKEIKRQLHEDPVSRIHISFDMWTSENRLALIGIVAHYLDGKGWRNQSRLLALRKIDGAHSGENMAAYLSEVAIEYDIVGKIGFFSLDNAESNDTCLRTFLRTAHPTSTDAGIKAHRIRCFGHVVNLAAKAFLFGNNAEAFEQEHIVNVALDQQMQEREAWRKHGAVGKLHNLATFIRRTPQRIELFKRISRHQEPGFGDSGLNEKTKNLGIILDNATRWNSTLDMITRALAKREELEMFVARLDCEPDRSKRVPLEDHLTNNDWLILAETAEILKPIRSLTIRLESRAVQATHGALWEAVPAIELLLEDLEKMKIQYQEYSPLPDQHLLEPNLRNQPSADQQVADEPPAHSTRLRRQIPPRPPLPPTSHIPAIQGPEDDASRRHIRIAINNAWDKLDKYYTLTDETPAYVAALVLHPGQKWQYFEKRWDQQAWLESAKAKMLAFYHDWQFQSAPITHDDHLGGHGVGSNHEMDDLDSWLTPHDYYAAENIPGDEYEAYLTVLPSRCDDIIGWWRDHQTIYPKLAQMAYDLIAVPAMSAECERVFSQAKLTVSHQRNRLLETTVDAIQCLKNWLRSRAHSLVREKIKW